MEPSTRVTPAAPSRATRPVRVMVVDDAVVVRRLVSDVLDAVSTIEVVGTAANGRLALAKLPQLQPDLVILDVEMPEMDGLETLTAMREHHRDLPVIMFSTLTERGASITLEALMRGANDYVTKPANVGSVSEAMERVRSELVPRIHSLCGLVTPEQRRPKVQSAQPRENHQPTSAGSDRGSLARRVDAVVVGVSTGGPGALAEIVPMLPEDLPVPVMVVQHMPPTFTRLLAERLDGTTPLAVAEAQGGETIEAGQCWLAPGDRHLALDTVAGVEAPIARTGRDERARLVVHDGPREHSCRPSVDVLFRSAADRYGPHLLGVVMTGMGQDGLHGCEAIVAAGGRVIVQDEATSVVWGMPGVVAEAGLADAVLPLQEIPAEIGRRVVAHRSGARPGAGVGGR